MSANQVVPGLASKATLFAILGGACIVALSILWGASVIGREIRCAGYLSSPGAADGVGVVAMRRALTKGIETATSPEDRVWFEADRRLREKLTIRDLGVWSHYPGDASQPLHVSVHYNGWGDYPNPQGFTPKKIHAYFEGEFVRSNLSRSAVAALVGPYAACECSIEEKAKRLLRASLAEVIPLYALEKDGGLKRGDPRGVAFATSRLAAGASALRDMIVMAWEESAGAMVGYPMVNLRDIKSGKVEVTRALFGAD